MESLLTKPTSTQSSKVAYFIATIAVIGCVAGVIAAYNYHQITSTSSLVYTREDLNPTTIWDLFTQWKIANNKVYDSAEEERTRFEIFQNNYVFILNHNANPTHTSTVGLNLYADLSSEEFNHFKNCFDAKAAAESPKNYQKLDATELPASVDWRQKNAVTPIKNQGQCGSCWAFSTTGSLEGLNAIKSGNLLSFSEQQLVDCSLSYGNEGCFGGLMDNAFKYVIANGIESELDYPYQGTTGNCQYSSSLVQFKNTGYSDVTPQDEAQLAAAVAQQPTSVAIEADQMVFQLYTSGIINTSACGTNLDHGVLAVGYDTDGTTDYWIVKNSWGASWGENGYVRIAKNTDQTGPGICGIASMPSYPTAQDSFNRAQKTKQLN